MNNFIPTLKYIWLTLKHKRFVFQAGLVLKVPIWQLIIHDLSKFSLKEAPHYGRAFFGERNDPFGFSYAWLNHQKNKHHWEYWVMVTGHNRGNFPDGTPLPMPEKYAREMVADWFGASKAYEGRWPISVDDWSWFINNFKKIKIADETRNFIIELLIEYFKDRKTNKK